MRIKILKGIALIIGLVAIALTAVAIYASLSQALN